MNHTPNHYKAYLKQTVNKISRSENTAHLRKDFRSYKLVQCHTPFSGASKRFSKAGNPAHVLRMDASVKIDCIPKHHRQLPHFKIIEHPRIRPCQHNTAHRMPTKLEPEVMTDPDLAFT